MAFPKDAKPWGDNVTTYVFETLTADDALHVGLFDDLTFSSGSATQMSVQYGSDGTITLTEDTRSVTFGIGFIHMTVARDLSFPDHSLLYIGDEAANTKDYSKITSDVEMYGGAGADVLTGGQARSVIQGNQGADTLSGSGVIYGGQDNDSITGVGFVQGNKGDDTITGGPGPATLLGGQGDDVIHATYRDGKIYGDLGNDQIFANDLQRLIDGGAGNDTIQAPYGTAKIDAGPGDDRIVGDDQVFWVYGGDGNDTISLSTLEATVSGGAGNDSIFVPGYYQGANELSGDVGNDTIIAGAGDTLSGGEGDDLLNGGTMIGGPGADRFGMGYVLFPSSPTNQVLDWSPDEKVQLPHGGASSITYSEATAHDAAAALSLFTASSSANPVMAIQVGADVLVFASGPLEVTLVGRTLADIDASNFV